MNIVLAEQFSVWIRKKTSRDLIGISVAILAIILFLIYFRIGESVHTALMTIQPGFVDSILMAVLIFPALFAVYFFKRKRETEAEMQHRKEAEEVLREREERFRIVFDWANDAILLHTLTVERAPGHFIEANIVACRMLGYSREELLAMGPTDIVLPELQPQLWDIIRQAQTKDTFLFETRLLRKDGTTFPVESSGHLVNYDGTRIWISHIRDITERKKSEELLRQSRAKYKQLVENISDVIFTLDLTGTFTYISPVVQRLYGYTVREVIGQHFTRFVHREDIPKVIEGFRRRVAGEYEANEFRILTKDGRERYVRTTQTPIMKEGVTTGFNYTLTDITERKNAEEVLTISEERFRQVAESAGEWIWEVDADGLYTYASPAVEKMLGYRPEEIIGRMHFYDLFAPEEKEELKKTALEAFATKEPFKNFVNPNLHKNGTRVILETSGVPHLEEQGRIIGYRGADTDITEKKRTEEALKETERNYRTLAEAAPDPIFIIGRDDTVRFVNTRAAQVLNLSTEHILNKPRKSLFPPDIADEQGYDLQTVFTTGKPLRKEAKIRYGDREFWQDNSLVPLTDEDGDVYAVLGISHDITERKLAEDALMRSEERFRSMAERVSDLIMLTDEKGRVTYIAPSVKRILGFDPDEILRKGPEDFIHPDDLEIVYEHVKRSPDWQGSEARFEARIRKKDGSYAILEFTGTPILKDDSAMQVIARDITDRKKAEEALWESKEKYRQLVDNTDTGFVVIDDKGTVIEANEPYMRLIGAEKREEIIGHSVIEWTAPEEQDSNAAAVALCSRQGFIQDFETIYQHRDGTHIHIIINATTNETPGGKRIVSFCRNITERKNVEEALNESEQRYRSLFENANEGILFADIETTKFVHANRAICRMLGYSNEDLMAMSVADIHPKESLDHVISEFQRLVTGEKGNLTDIPCLKKDGTIRMMDIASSTVMMQGRMCMVGLFTDITERKNAEKALKESEEKFRNIFDNANDAIEIIEIMDNGFPGRYLDINDVACRMLGYTREELLQFGPLKITTDNFSRPHDEIIRELRDVGRAIFETEHRRKDGIIVPVEINAHKITLVGKTVFLSIARDITERKKVEDALRESHAKYRQLVENISDVILTLDLNGTVTYISPVVQRLFGYTVPEVVGQHFSRFVHPEDISRVLERFRHRVKGEYGANEFRLLTKDGQERYVRTNQTPMMADGVVTGFNYVMRDITGRKQAEDALRESEEKFRLLYENSMDAIFLTSTDGSIQAANPAACTMLQRTEDEIIRIGRTGVVDTTDPRLAIAIQERERTGRFEGELTFVRKDGTRFFGEITSSVFADRNGQKRTSMIVRDITERKHAEDALRESENYVKTVLDSIDVGFVIIDPATHRILDANTIAVNLIGVAKEKIVGSECHRFICPADKGNCPITDLHQTIDDSERILIRSGNEQCPIIKTVIPLMLGGKPVLLESFIDITLQKEAENILQDFNKKLQQGIEEKTAILRESELRHSRLFESSHDAIMTLEPPDWRFTSGNPATIAMFRADDESGFTSKAPWELSPEFQPDGRPSGEKAKEMIGTAMRDGSNYFEWTHRRLTGEDFPATVLLTRFEWKGKPILQATVRDISEQKDAEDKIRASLDEKVLLLREIHHRVKNNLQIIISLVNLQMRQIDDKRLKQVMAETQNRVRAMSLVHEKLYQSEDISRIDLANYTRFLVTQLFSFYGVDTRQVTLNIDIGKIRLDINTAIPLGLIINELASNALKHAFPDGRTGTLSITVIEKGTTLLLTVKNDGVGVPADFDWRNTESLGLRLVISLVEQLDGTIELDRSAGTGFTIVVKEKEQKG
ncbi:MAG: PAS domain S-box protein [Methanoregula sp.]